MKGEITIENERAIIASETLDIKVRFKKRGATDLNEIASALEEGLDLVLSAGEEIA
ncbi:MAG: hypothetical protein AABY78_01515 [Nitrospirota bacterium]